MVLKFTQQGKYALKTEKYMINFQFFSRNLSSKSTWYSFFLGIFSAKKRYAYCTSAHYATLFTVINESDIK